MSALALRVLPGTFAICRLAPDAPVPAWANSARGFVSITRTDDELSIVCRASAVPARVRAARGWALLQLAGPFPFDAVGILSSVLAPLAAAQISVLALATFDTDYVLVKRTRLAAARRALTAAGLLVQ